MKSLLCTPALLAGLLGVSLCLPLQGYAGDPVRGAPSSSAGTETAPTPHEILIPGPLRSLLRMAGISQEIFPDDVLPLLARNVYSEGYQGSRPTEFLILLERYVQQARELQLLAGASGTIRLGSCGDARPLLHILGYAVRPGCGQKGAYLVTANPERAFITNDSGFPLVRLEEAIGKGTPFSYRFAPTPVPVLLSERDWTVLSKERSRRDGGLLDVLLHDPVVARLYWALAQNDGVTRRDFDRSPGLKRLLPYASVLDFYGSRIAIRSGRVIVPGGPAAEPGWKNLVGASPDAPGEFVLHLISKDKGWLATYFDYLSRVDPAQQAHFTEAPRLRRLYLAFRQPDPGAGAADAAFRRAPALLILFNRLEWTPAGEPRVPGNLEIWKEFLSQKTDSKLLRDWGKRASRWQSPEQLLEAMAAFSRLPTDNGPLQTYLALSEIDNRRPPEKQLSAGTVLLLARKFSQLRSWYPIFSEFPGLNEESILRFVTVAGATDRIPSQSLRGDATGILQANIGLWEILARQGEIRNAGLNSSWQNVIEPFARISSSSQLFDSGRASLGALLQAAGGNANPSQDEAIDLLAGPPRQSAYGQQVRIELGDKIRAGLEGQRLVSLDTLFTLGDGLTELARGEAVGARLIPLADELRGFEMPRPIFSRSEKAAWGEGADDHSHAELQVRTNLARVIKAPASRAQLDTARGQLAPFLRDTLVGLNYAYDEPPGAQVLHADPLFVRSHDFSGESVTSQSRFWEAPQLLNGGPAGGGAYLIGSLADLPFVLAAAEQNFIAPEHVQALIWEALVPELLTSATVTRWWNVSPQELHAVALYQRSGEELLTRSVDSQELRAKVISILSARMAPKELEEVDEALRDGNIAAMLPRIMPADTFYLAVEFQRKFPAEFASSGPSGQQLQMLCKQYPAEVSLNRLSKDFGVPHPVLAGSYGPELLDLEPFPPFEGEASRTLGESWDSSDLYWARLADEMGYPPVALNLLVPELTRQMVAKIFATDLEDWPALLRAMLETGEEFRQGKIEIALPESTNTVALR